MNGTTVAWMKKQALKYNIAICGSTIISEKEEIYNRFLFVTPDATAYYDKRHLFAMGGEQACYNSGNSQVVVNFRGWRIMLLICYDLRFPVWSRNKNNYDLVIYVANWPASRRKVWDTLLKARAIENQCYVAGCNRVGTDDRNIVYNGGSKIVDERGELINEDADNAQGIIHSKISLDRLHKFRDDFPVWKDADNFKIVD
jgi:predicted amidohydrolase